MNKTLNGKGYIQGGEGYLITSDGRRYNYHDGQLTPEPTQKYEYQGTFELQPQHDPHRSFYGKAFVERWTANHHTRLALTSYGTTVATITPTDTDTYRIDIAMQYLSATTLRHVKEFLAQTDDTFKGITLPWLRKAVKDRQQVEGAGKTYTLNEL